MSHVPLFQGFWKQLYSATLFGKGFGHYFRKEYAAAEQAYKKALTYYENNDLKKDYDIHAETAYEHMGHIYEEGLGVEQDELQAEEYFLRAGTRGNSVYEHELATRSFNEKYRK